MRYGDGGTFLDANKEPTAEKWLGYHDLALSHAVPFAEWWERHGSA